MLSEEQKRDAVLILSVGCDRATAAKYVGCDPDEFIKSCVEDPGFAREVRRAESGCELAHMRNVQQAARDERHWRASVWWLERRAPDRYAKRERGAVDRRELERFMSAVAEMISETAPGERERERLLQGMTELTRKLTDESPIGTETTDP